jgi:hypothetical protein
MNLAIPYPLDYQLTLARTIGIRLDSASRAGRAAEIPRLKAALGRLRSGEIAYPILHEAVYGEQRLVGQAVCYIKHLFEGA